MTALTFWIRAFIVVLWCSALGAAQSEPQTYRPWFDEVVLGNCRSLVVARVKNVDVLPNHQRLVRFTVDRVLRGDESDEILVLGADDRLIAFRDLQKLLFLEPTRHGSMRLVQDHVDLPKDEARERVDFVTAMVAVCDQVGSLRREAAAKTLLSTWIEAKSPWVRRVLVEEIDQLSRWRPASIDVALFGKIEKISQEGFEDETRRRLRSVMQGLEAKASVAWTHDELAFPDDASRQRFLELYTSFQRGVLSPEQSLKFLTQTLKSYGRRAAPILVPLLESEDATLRSFGTKWLGELEASAGTDALWKIARGDRPLVDRLAALDALAKIAPDVIVEGLIRLESRQDLPLTFHRSLLTTLAAINSPEAALHLRDRHEVLKRDEEGAAELRLHLTWLLSPAFQKEWLEARALRRRRIDEGRLDLDETLPVPPR